MNQKGKRPFKGKPASRDQKSDSKFVKEKVCANDPAWYVRSPQLAKDVASLSFNNAAGAKVYLSDDNSNGDAVVASTPLNLPGIMSITTMPFMGVSTGPSSPINIAAKNLYTFVRHANSGHTNYDSPDLMLYVMAMDSIYAGIAHIQRALGTANLFSQVNRYTMDAMLMAEGFNPQSVRNDLANARARLNMLILKANSFCIPKTMTLFNRHMWMYTSIFQDSPVAKCQFYLYRPQFLYRYTETSGGPGYLEPVAMFGVINTVPSTNEQYYTGGYQDINLWFTKVEDLLSRLIESEDINIMSGDILKAYGRENIFQMAPITEEYVVVPFYSEEVLDQIHNTMFTSSYIRTVTDLSNADQVKKVNTASLRYTQVVSTNGNYLICSPKFARGITTSITKLVDMADSDPSPERVLVATRNMLGGSTSLTQVSDVKSITTLDTAASDLCLNAVVTYATMVNSAWDFQQFAAYNGTVAYTAEIEKFQKAPIGYAGAWSEDTYVPQTPFFEIGNYTTVTSAMISKMHESAILSMLGVPV